MARLLQLTYKFYDLSLNETGGLVYSAENKCPIASLPQIFWQTGESWSEANQFALNQMISGSLSERTVHRKMKHIHYFAGYLEEQRKDWRLFPRRTEDQILIKFKKHLIEQCDFGLLHRSTASNCMSAVVEFYRFARDNNFINPANKMWNERLVNIHTCDSVGFQRVFTSRTTNLKIPNRTRHGITLEDGLTPLLAAHMTELLKYTSAQATKELHLMLCTGFFSGARNDTVGNLTVSSLYTASPDPNTEGIFRLPVGPGTNIPTKNATSGALWIPEALLQDLKEYATSTKRLLREARAKAEHKGLLFLTKSGRPYTVPIVDRLVQKLRKDCVKFGMRFMKNFIFHQSRATFGTWLTQELLLARLDTVTVLSEVKSALFHKYESTTWRYIKFLEATKAKIEAAAKFNELFTGIKDRDWSAANA